MSKAVNKAISRRDFLKFAGGGVAVLVVGSKLDWVLNNPALAAVPVQTLDLHITDAIKQMHTHTPTHQAECYFWIYKAEPSADLPDGLPPQCPGPSIMVTKGESVHIKVTNDLDENHGFAIPQLGVDSGPIPPGGSWEGDILAAQSGAFLYYDNLNEPVNRVMGLHGAFIVMPGARRSIHRLTPYDRPTPNVQAIFDAFGNPDVYPGLAWEEGDEATHTPPFRHCLWLLHEASARLFAEVGEYPAGQDYPAQEFIDKFLKAPLRINNNENVHLDEIEAVSYKPQYFTIDGQSGFFSHHSGYVTPMGRVGAPVVVHILNAGLWLHSLHLHGNHFYLTCINGVAQENPLWLDVFNIRPMDRVDYTVPFMRPPDVGSVRGIGLPEAPLTSLNGHPVWPPVEEINMITPPNGGNGFRLAGFDKDGKPIRGEEIDLSVRLSPLCYPMHDHSEPSQTTQGGNYNTAMISGMYFLGDRNTPGHMDFPVSEDFALMSGGVYSYPEPGTHLCVPDPHDETEEVVQQPATDGQEIAAVLLSDGSTRTNALFGCNLVPPEEKQS